MAYNQSYPSVRLDSCSMAPCTVLCWYSSDMAGQVARLTLHPSAVPFPALPCCTLHLPALPCRALPSAPLPFHSPTCSVYPALCGTCPLS